MFIRTKALPDNKRYRVQVVESQRVGTKVRQVIIGHMGISMNDDHLKKLVQLAEEFIINTKKEREQSSGQLALFAGDHAPKLGRPKKKSIADIIPTKDVSLDDIVETKRIIEGVHDVGGAMYKMMGFDELLPRKSDKAILQDIVLSRMVLPSSKRNLCNVLKDNFGKEHDLDAVYRMMDKLHGEIKTIKQLCFNASKQLFANQEVSMLFYDVTTLYIESEIQDDLREYGYSKDGKFNNTQVVLALATNEDGLPIGYELFQGNTAEVKTLIKAMDEWSNYLDIKDLYFVCDRAMFSQDNMDELDRKGYKYVIAAKLKSLSSSVKAEIFAEENYQIKQVGEDIAWVNDIAYGGKRLIVSYKSQRARKDKAKREKVLDKARKVLANNKAQNLVTNQGLKKYTSMQDTVAYVDNDKVEREEIWDGIHGIITNDHDITPQEALAKYGRLWVIEESFRINKHNLKMRPIHHYNRERIEAHIAICYMSFALLRQIEYRVALSKKISPGAIVETLLSVQASIYEHKKTKDSYRVPGVMSIEARRIYQAFNLERSVSAEIYL